MTDGAHKASVTIDAKVEAADRNIKKLTRRINKMEGALSKSDKSAAKQAETLRKVGRASAIAASAVIAAALGFGRLAVSSAESANETAKTAKGLGVATKGLQRLEFAASRATKATSEQLHKGIATLTVGLQDAVTKGTGPVAEGLDAIGVSAFDLRGLDVEEQFAVLADAMQRVPVEADRSAISMKLFGKRAGGELAPLLAQTRDQLRGLGDESERLGLVLDDKTLEASEEFVDSVSDMKLTVSAAARDISLSAIPALKNAADRTKDWTVENRELIDQDIPIVIGAITDGVGGLVSNLSVAIEMFADARRGADSLVGSLGPVADWFGAAVDYSNPTGALFKGADALGTIGDFAIAGSADGGLGASIRAAAEAQAGATPRDTPIGADFGPSLDQASKKVQEAQDRLAKGLKATGKATRGAKKDTKSLIETMLELDQAKLAAFSDDEVDTSFLDSGLVDPFGIENREIGLAEMRRVAEEERGIENARRQGQLDDELRHLELRREMGADPLQLIDQEKQARLEYNAFMLDQAESEASRLQLQNQQRQIAHDAEMQRLKVEQQQQKKRMAVYAEVGQGIDTIYRATAEAALASALSQEGSVREAVKSTAKAEAVRSTIMAGSALVQALFWSAVPGGQGRAVRFFAASGVAAAKATAFGALAGGLSGSGGGGGTGSTPGALTGSSFGGEGSTGASQPQAALPAAPSAGSAGAGSAVPGSPTTSPGTSAGDPSTSGQAGGPNFNGAVFHMYGTPHEDFIESVTRGQGQLRLNRRS